MSLISDALKKAESQRTQPSLNRVSNWDPSPHSPAPVSPAVAVRRTSSRGLLWTNLGVLALLCLVAVYLWRDRPLAGDGAPEFVAQENAETVDIDATALPDPPSTEAPDASEPVPLATTSPFAQSAAQPVAEPAVTDDYDLGGTSTLGSNTLLSVVRRSDHRSIWIPVGKTVGDVTAVSYDPEKDQAVIRVRGNLLTISMRQFADDPEHGHDAEAAE